MGATLYRSHRYPQKMQNNTPGSSRSMVATKMAKAATGSGRTPPISKRLGMDCSRNKATASRA